MLSLSRTKFVALKQAEKCVQKVEFYRGKSTANYRIQAGDNWQSWAEIWSSISEQLEELSRLRNEVIAREKE